MIISDLSLGPIIAATVAGAISLVSLIISKENKTSEFRQLWIDALRSDLSTYVSHIMEIHRHRVWDRESSDEKWESISDSYQKVNESITKIRLRLNPAESPSKQILLLLKEYEKAFLDNGFPSQENFNKLNHNFVEASQKLLKSEWNRVRNGEIVFQVIRAISFVILMAGLIVLLHQLYLP